MSERKCGCVIATEINTPSVKRGFEVGGYIKEFCDQHKPKSVEVKHGLDRVYDAEMRKDDIYKLSEKIWDAMSEVDYDPMHPKFDQIQDPTKDKVIEYATDIILGFPSLNK